MLESNVGKVRRWAAAMAVASMIVGSGAANAAVFTTDWDPLFNPSFTSFASVNLGWSGSATIDVPNSCVQFLAEVDFIAAGPCQGAASLIGYTYTLYDADTSTNLFSGGSAGNLSPDPDVVRFDAGGIANGFTLPGVIVPSLSPFFINGYYWDAELDFVISPAYTGPTLRLSADTCGGNINAADIVDECFAQFDSDISGVASLYRPTVTWRQVPEPASLLLVGLALFAAGTARRRR